ncbi:MAG: LamB/YcsF family protein, partial [Hyphomicrobiaceae bacterium]
MAEFIAEYQAEWNRLQAERRVSATQRDCKLAEVNRRISGIVDAIERGIITPTTKQRLEALEAEKAKLEHSPVEAPPPAIHPNLAQLYRTKVARLDRAWDQARRGPADMGESYGRFVLGHDIEMVPYVKSISVACGYHAADPGTMLKS